MKRGRFLVYDKQQVLQDIVQGTTSAQEIASKHGITRDMVYSLKHAAKEKNIIRDPAQRLDDLDTVEPKRPRTTALVNVIYNLAQEYKEGMLSPATFYKHLVEELR